MTTPQIDATGKTDVSVAMAEYFDRVPAKATIDLAPKGTYRMDKTLVLDQFKNLTIEGHGATFVSASAGDKNRSNIEIRHGAGVTLKDVFAVGSKPAGVLYRPEFEGQHGFKVVSSECVFLLGCGAKNVSGDFVYVGKGDSEPTSKTVLVQNGVFNASGRQGLTCVSGDNIVFDSNKITDATRSTFDFEPGMADANVTNVQVINNKVFGGRLNFISAAGRNKVDHVLVQGNVLSNHTLSIVCTPPSGFWRYDWTILDNVGSLLAGGTHAVINMTNVDGLVVQRNEQAMKVGRGLYGVWARNCRNVKVDTNKFANSKGQLYTGAT